MTTIARRASYGATRDTMATSQEREDDARIEAQKSKYEIIEPDDEEVLETPAFFYDGPLSKLTRAPLGRARL